MRHFLVLALLAACSAAPPGPDAGEADSGADAGVDAGFDAGEPDAGVAYPAFTFAPPQVRTKGGPVLQHPRIVAVVFEGDPFTAELTSFISEIGQGADYWQRATSEYGVGPLAGATLVIAHEAPPATATTQDVRTWVGNNTQSDGGGAPLLGAFDPDTFYTVFYPPSTNVVLEGLGAQCAAFGGYHLDQARADGGTLLYVAIPRCPDLMTMTSLELATVGASHEWAEGAADPHGTTQPAWASVDDDDFAWAVSFSDYPIAEIGDMCALRPDNMIRPPGFTHAVQRIWSNAEAAAHRDPCVPVPAGAVYFGAEPVLPDAVTLTPVATPVVHSRGVHVPLGTSQTIELQLYSNAPKAEWTVFAEDVRALLGEPPRLMLSTDKAHGQNGDVVHLTLQAVAPGPLGGAPFAVYAMDADGGWNVAFGFVQN